ncbi:unnamed protein product, partial [Mesorhabditis spiculigera]
MIPASPVYIQPSNPLPAPGKVTVDPTKWQHTAEHTVPAIQELPDNEETEPETDNGQPPGYEPKPVEKEEYDLEEEESQRIPVNRLPINLPVDPNPPPPPSDYEEQEETANNGVHAEPEPANPLKYTPEPEPEPPRPDPNIAVPTPSTSPAASSTDYDDETNVESEPPMKPAPQASIPPSSMSDYGDEADQNAPPAPPTDSQVEKAQVYQPTSGDQMSNMESAGPDTEWGLNTKETMPIPEPTPGFKPTPSEIPSNGEDTEFGVPDRAGAYHLLEDATKAPQPPLEPPRSQTPVPTSYGVTEPPIPEPIRTDSTIVTLSPGLGYHRRRRKFKIYSPLLKQARWI